MKYNYLFICLLFCFIAKSVISQGCTNEFANSVRYDLTPLQVRAGNYKMLIDQRNTSEGLVDATYI